MTQEEKNRIAEILDPFVSFLCKKGYTDADVYAEEPTAIESYLETL